MDLVGRSPAQMADQLGEGEAAMSELLVGPADGTIIGTVALAEDDGRWSRV